MPIYPVCGMKNRRGLSQFKSKSGGKTIYFSCPHCKSRFDKDPAKFNA